MRLARVNQAKNHPGRKLSEPGETTIPRDHSQDPCYWLASGASSFARAAAVVVLLLVGVRCWSKLRNSLSRLLQT